MATLTIRNLDESVKQALRERAARHGVSMEEEARVLLRTGLSASAEAKESRWDRVSRLREKYGPADLEIPERTQTAGDRNVSPWLDDE